MYEDRRSTRSNSYSDNRKWNSNEKSSGRPSKLEVPKNYVDEAEKVMRRLKSKPTTSKLRNIYSIVCDIYNDEIRSHDETISKESAAKLQKLRIRIIYEAGRESNVKEFVKNSQILKYIKGINDNRENMLRFCHYMEALVAYHRFYGGKES